MDMLRYIPIGRRNARSRYEIAEAAGVSERKVREVIAEINKSGEAVVIADASLGGYYIPDLPRDRKYLDIYLRQEAHRAREILDKVNAMRGRREKGAGQCAGQMSLFEVSK